MRLGTGRSTGWSDAAAYSTVIFGILLIAPLRIVRYHTLFWQFTGRRLGLGWTAGREQALDAAVNAAIFVPLGFLGHRWWRAGSTPSWAAASATLTTS